MPGAEFALTTGAPPRRKLLIAVLMMLATSSVFAAEPRRVLLVHAFGHPYSPWSDIAGSFRAELIKKSPEPIDLYEISLDTAHVRDPRDEQPFVDYIHALLGTRKLDLMVPVGAPAAYFMERHRSELFPQVPMLIIGADTRRLPPGMPSDQDAAVLLNLDLPAYLENILRLLPDTKNVGVVAGNSPVERFWTGELRRDSQPFAGRINIEWFNDLSFAEMLARAASMPVHSAILWGLLSEDAAGVPYMQDRALEALREVSAAPVFGIGDYEMGRGIVGGPLIQTQGLGQEAAHVALRILNGEKPRDIHPAPMLYGAPVYDWRELQYWGISEKRLPPGAIVEYREPTEWQRYRWEFLLVAAILIAQTGLVAYVLLQSRWRRAAEAEAAEQRREVTHLMRVSLLGELSGAIAHEINQPLAAILSNAQAALHLLAQNSPDLNEVRDAISDIVQEDNRAGDVIGRLRALLKKGERKLERVDLNALVTSTVALLNSELIGRRIEVETDLARDLPPISGDSVQLQQVLLNLFMNAMDAMASTPNPRRRIVVSTHVTASRDVEVLVKDHGHGIAANDHARLFKPFYTSKEHGLGLGLTICSTIAQVHGGKLTLANHAAGGAIAAFSLPVHELLVPAK